MRKAEVAAAIFDQRVIAIVRADAPEDAHRAVTALLRAGLRLLRWVCAWVLSRASLRIL